MPPVIDFYFDFSSPYGYFGSMRIDALAEALGMQARWHPILLGPLFKVTGAAPLVQIPLKAAYGLHDMARTARLYGIPYHHPDPFPIGTVAAARIMLHLQEHDDEQAKRFAREALHAYFVDNRPIGDVEVALDIAAGVGADRAATAAAIASDPIKQRLREHNEAALKRGVFGSPFMLIGDEPFWGFDRFDAIRLWVNQNRALLQD